MQFVKLPGVYRFDYRLAYLAPPVVMLCVSAWLFRRRSGYASGHGVDDPVDGPHGRDGLPRDERSRPRGRPTGPCGLSDSGCTSTGEVENETRRGMRT